MARRSKRRQHQSKEDSDTPRKGDKSKQYKGIIKTKNNEKETPTDVDIPTTPPKTNDTKGTIYWKS